VTPRTDKSTWYDDEHELHPVTGQPQIEESPAKHPVTGEPIPETTARQAAIVTEAEKAWAEEQTWPLFDVVLVGDEAPWVPRRDPRYWQPADPNNPDSPWVPLPAKALPDDARLADVEQVNDKGETVTVSMVHRVSRATVTCRARSEEHAKMLALRDNPTYHTVESVTKRG